MAGEHVSHGTHHSSDAESSDPDGCDHCPPGGHKGEYCGSGVNADCGGVQDANAETRTTLKKFKDVPATPGLAGPDPGPVRLDSSPPPPPVQLHQLKYRTVPSLSILNCVFLK